MSTTENNTKTGGGSDAPRDNCIYCGAEDIPQPNPDGSNPYWYRSHDWEAEAKLHSKDCEWVLTRAHTQADPWTDEKLHEMGCSYDRFDIDGGE